MRAGLRTLRSALMNDRALFVFVNVGVNLLFLVRSYVTMRALDYGELGLVALLQSIILLISTLQFGILNGGYRLLCAADDESARSINNLIYSYVGVLCLAALACSALALSYSSGPRYSLVAGLGVLAGIVTLVRNWMSSQLIAMVRLRKLNQISLWSAVASMVPLAFVRADPLLACLIAVVLQPVTFAVAVLVLERPLRPTAFSLPRTLVKQVLYSGFVVFLTGVFLQVNTQLERWYVVKYIGLSGLGHLYLAILFIGLFQIVPSSLDALFLPKLVQAHAARETRSVSRNMRRFFLIAGAYCTIAELAVLLLAKPVLELVLPTYVPDLLYVHMVMPGLILMTMASPFAIAFNVLIRYRFYFYAYGLGTGVTLAVLALSAASGRLLGLAEVTLLRSGVYALMAAVLLLGYLLISRSHAELRFNPFRSDGGRA